MKQTLQIKLTQNLTMTPQLQQAIRLLQLSTLELGQELENYLAMNPLLERVDDDWPKPPPSSDQYQATETAPADNANDLTASQNESESNPWDTSEQEGNLWGEVSASAGQHTDDDDNDYQDVQAAATSLKEHLIWQLGLAPLGDTDRALVRFLIEALDDDGYLSMTLEEIAGEFAENTEHQEHAIDCDDLRIALKYLQNFDPCGIGARNAQECLLLQLQALPDDSAKALALVIVEHHLNVLASRDFATLKKLTGSKEETLRAANHLIQRLNPRPGAQYAPIDTRYIIPDVIVRKLRGAWTASINPEAYPRLRINRLYAQLLQGQNGSMSEQLQEARWLIRNVQQRFVTIQSVSQAIVDQQRQFFEHGEAAMRPLILRKIAEQLDLHESTVSRVTTQKFMATPLGVFELKYFFGSHVATDSGGACSSTAIRAVIKQLVGSENARKPLSDNKISELLGQQGIVVARRTVAKYREAIGIPPANLRKTL